MSDELIDIFDSRGRPLGVQPREEAHRLGNWHRVFHCWVLFRDESGRGQLVLQKRGSRVRHYAGFLDVSAAGHYRAGESVEEGLRELEEELGINTSWDSLVPVGIRINVDDAVDGLCDREFQHLYLLEWSADPESYRVQEEEVDGLVVAPVAELLALFAGDRQSIPAASWPGNGRPLSAEARIVEVRREHFVPTLDDYSYRAVIAAERMLRGDRHLRI